MPRRAIATGLAMLLLEAGALGGDATCTEQWCDRETCYDVPIPCGWPCGDAEALSLRATRGALDVAERRCLEEAWALSSSTSAREPYHRLLVVDAAARRDWSAWDRFAVEHLDVLSAPTSACRDLAELPRRAEGGALGPAEVACIEARLARAESAPERAALSTLLVENASRRFDRGTWQRLVHDHLLEIAPGDRAVAADYLDALSAREPGVPASVAAWAHAELADDEDRARGLHAIASLASLAWVEAAERAYVADPSGARAAEVEVARRQAAAVSRSWARYAASSAPADARLAAGACAAAGGGAACCDGAGLVCAAERWGQVSSCGAHTTSRALLGALSGDARACLGTAIALSSSIAERRELSRLLVVDAWVAGDDPRFARTARLHLDRVDPGDAQVALALARELLSEAPEEALGRAEVALGDARGRGEALAVRARAAHRLWEDAEALASDSPSTATRRFAGARREQALAAAQDWLAHEEAAGGDASVARSLCQETAPSPAACAR